MRLSRAAFLTLAISWCAFGQPPPPANYTIQTFAGGGVPWNVPGTSASLQSPSSIAVDGAGNLFFAELNHVVLRLDATTGTLTLVAGNGTAGFSGDNGPAAGAQLAYPQGVAVDAAGNLYIADSGNNRIRKVSNGVITTVAGNGAAGYGGDNGPAASAQLNDPEGVAVDAGGDLYIADTGNNRIRKVSNGVIVTVAGNGTAGYSGDSGSATSAQLADPQGIAVDAAGNLYIADTYNDRIRKVSNGVITTVAGGGSAFGDNGPATSAELGVPQGVAVDAAGNLYIVDTGYNRIRKVSNGVIVTVAGNGTAGFSGDNGPATNAGLNLLFLNCPIPQYRAAPTEAAGAVQAFGCQASAGGGGALDSAGNLYIADSGNNRIRKVSSGAITTVAGNGEDNGPATSAQLDDPSGVALDAVGNVYIADSGNNRVRKVSNGVMTAAAGSGETGFSGDNGPATSAMLNHPLGVAVDAAGGLYIVDDNSRIRKVSNGVITTVAGTGTSGFTGDGGPATSAQLRLPEGVAANSAGTLYIADTWNHRIRKVSNGVITTVVGNGGYPYGGDNGPATSAQLYSPVGIAFDSAGSLYIADSNGDRIRKVSNGVITTVAGNGTYGYSGDNGPATSAQLADPSGVALDSAGNLYIADSGNQRIREVSNGVIVTVAGGGSAFGDNGPATSAQLSNPNSVAVDAAGNVYIADSGNNRIRVLIPSGQPLLLAITTPSTLPSGFTGASYSQTLAAIGGVPPYTWSVASGALPAGLSLSSGGVIGGIPTAGGSSLFTVTASDASLRSVSQSFLLTISLPLVITTPSALPPGLTGALYSQSLAATGGVPPYTWSILSGALPAGMALSSAGVIAGIPTTGGTSAFSVSVSDAGSRSVSQSFTLTIIPALAIATLSTLPSGVAGAAYSQTIAVTGGYPPYTWSVTSGALPPLLALSTAGVIAGTPTSAGISTFSVSVSDSTLHFVSQAFTLNISLGPLAIATSSTLPSGFLGAPYSQTLAATGGIPPYTWRVTSGTWPVGLSITPAGVIAGVPTVAGTSTFGVNVTDASSNFVNQSFTLTISATSLAVTTPSALLPGVTGGAYSQALGAAGGVPPYTWSILPGALPPGLALSSAGVIAGTPAAAGVYSFTAQVQDSASATASQAFSLTVAAAGVLSRAGVISQFVAGGGWDTTVWIVNRSAAPVPTRLVFHGDDGAPLSLSLTVTQPGVSQQVAAATLDRVIASNTTLVVATGASASPVQGWADVLSSGALSGFAVFRYAGASEAAVPLQSQIGSSISLPFDNTGGYSTGIAIVNLSSWQANITATVWDENGTQLVVQPVALTKTDSAGDGHDSFMLPDRLAVTAGKRGIVQFQSNPLSPFTPVGPLTGLGLRADPNGLFTSIPTIVP